MKEFQHRVKNNLATIHGLLEMEIPRLNDPEAVNVFLDAQSRIQSMMEIYKQLYRSGGRDTVSLKQYLQTTAAILFSTYNVRNADVVLVTELDDVTVDFQKAADLGLILNELITNALKYAYPPGASGSIRVTLSRIAGDQIKLAVSDSGVGLPRDFNRLNNQSLGMDLIGLFAKNVNGQLTIESNNGTQVSVTLPA